MTSNSMQDLRSKNIKFIPNTTSAASTGQSKEEVFASSITLEHGMTKKDNPFALLSIPR
jgi:hypothetical protein